MRLGRPGYASLERRWLRKTKPGKPLRSLSRGLQLLARGSTLKLNQTDLGPQGAMPSSLDCFRQGRQARAEQSVGPLLLLQSPKLAEIPGFAVTPVPVCSGHESPYGYYDGLREKVPAKISSRKKIEPAESSYSTSDELGTTRLARKGNPQGPKADKTMCRRVMWGRNDVCASIFS